MKKFIVITTVYQPTEAIKLFMSMPDWELIIVGDLKTPHNSYKELEKQGKLIYLDPQYQEKRYHALSEAIGWNTSPRRNIGFIEAFKRGADILALTDDDNIPYEEWGKNLLINKKIICDQFTPCQNTVFDPLSVTNHPELWHRGFPLQQVSTRYNTKSSTTIVPKIQVDLWNGAPDVDATCRMIYKPDVTLEISSPYCSPSISPFDSQNTFLAREMISEYMLIPHIGRVDDIWGSYLLQMNSTFEHEYIVYNKPTVYQNRNEHDLMKDFEAEVFGTIHVEAFLAGKDVLSDASKRAIDIYKAEFVR
jgi:hypothetical protein